MTYRLEVERRAVRQLEHLPREFVGRLLEVMRGLREHPRPPGAKKLTAREGYRLRVGDYRILYQVDDAARLVRVYLVGHRRDVYR